MLDGHRKVTEESLQYSSRWLEVYKNKYILSYIHITLCICSRLVQLGNFWQHLKTSGYGQANTSKIKTKYFIRQINVFWDKTIVNFWRGEIVCSKKLTF